MTRTTQKILRGLALPVGLLGLWQLSASLGWTDVRFLPPLDEVGGTFLRELGSGGLATNIGASLGRNLAGFALGAGLGLAFGTATGLSRPFDRLFGPSFHALKQIALLAWVPLISMWFGFGETAKVAFIALGAFIPVALNTHEGMRSASAQLVEVGTALRFSRAQFLRKLFLPSALPSIATGLQLGLIYSWLGTIGAEYFMAVGPGIGGLIIAGRERFEMDLVMVGVVLLGVIGFALNALATAATNRLLVWRTA
ncbi:ABC transporter permease [Methylopila sp. Yamaguchi]|uniref:ABC transporter permease n=1 Tax=Methylopila sp. Yamaguchi TaxID=1437817 RepID=UPI000CC5EFF7|nr:ABC transporter permease [Methylopila sp. Yamaguchi]GBD46846.1 nitrate/sulfonate/bicarbonate ABC transporter permease [Methylopila sp. Yamaguchi]